LEKIGTLAISSSPTNCTKAISPIFIFYFRKFIEAMVVAVSKSPSIGKPHPKSNNLSSKQTSFILEGFSLLKNVLLSLLP